MGKTLDGKHGPKSGKQPLAHHTGKWVSVGVRFPREMAKCDRSFDASITFLVPSSSSAGETLRSCDLGGLHISGNRLIRMFLAGYLTDRLQGFWQKQKDGLEAMGAPDHVVERELAHLLEMQQAMSRLVVAINRRVQRTRTETNH